MVYLLAKTWGMNTLNIISFSYSKKTDGNNSLLKFQNPGQGKIDKVWKRTIVSNHWEFKKVQGSLGARNYQFYSFMKATTNSHGMGPYTGYKRVFESCYMSLKTKLSYLTYFFAMLLWLKNAFISDVRSHTVTVVIVHETPSCATTDKPR